MFVANRGEIATRISRTCDRLGIRVVVPATEGPDALDLLDAGAVVRAALDAGADTVHPGFGFLAENADFAEAVIEAGMRWVGPPPTAIRAMGDKAAARRLAVELGVPVLRRLRRGRSVGRCARGGRGADRVPAARQAGGRRRGQGHAHGACRGAACRCDRLSPARGLGRLRGRPAHPRAAGRRRTSCRDPGAVRWRGKRGPPRRARLFCPASTPESARGDALPGGRSRASTATGRDGPAPGSCCLLRRRRDLRVLAR